MLQKPILIIKAGTTFPETVRRFGDFEDWTRTGTGLSDKEAVVAAVFDGDPLPGDKSFSGVVVTGSHSMVTDREPWCEKLKRWIRRVVQERKPFLGLCFGHQLLALAMGGTVGDHPKGREIGTVSIQVSEAATKDQLLKNLPRQLYAHVTHSQTVLGLPVDAVLLAGNEFEPHHAFRIGHCAWGVQFHPEFDAAIMRSYVEEQTQELVNEGLDVSTIFSRIHETPEANSIMRRFANSARHQSE